MDIMKLSDVGMVLVISAAATVLLLAYFWPSSRNPKYPPCPMRVWPIVGNLFLLRKDPQEQFARFRKQCGDIYSLYLGTTNVVVLTGLDVLKEALVKNGINFSDRAVLHVDVLTNTVGKGLAASNGAAWREHRTFTTALMKNAGNYLFCDKIQDEVNHFMGLLESFKGEPKDVHEVTTSSVTNIICSILRGQRHQYNDTELITIAKNTPNIISLIKDTSALHFVPLFYFLPFFYFRCKTLNKFINDLFGIFDGYLLEVNLGYSGMPENLIAAYIQEMKMKEMKGEKTFMNKQSLKRLMLDMFVAGTETTSTTLRWFFLHMVNYPDVQEKIYQEIKEVVGLERAPVMQDKAKLTYLVATIMEVQRSRNVITLAIARVVTRDVSLRGFNIPKGTEIIIHLDPVMNDPSLWGDDTDKFRPERFIDKDGNLISPEAWMPFLIGKRSCVAEGMAKMELFLYLSNIVQRFHILPADPKLIPSLKRNCYFTNNPLPNLVRFIIRRSD